MSISICFYHGNKLAIIYQTINNLKVSKKLLSFVNDELLSGTNISPEEFWLGFDKAVHELTPKNRDLIKVRDNLQKKIDEWHINNRGNKIKIEVRGKKYDAKISQLPFYKKSYVK